MPEREINLKIPISTLGLSTPIVNRLYRAGIFHLDDLLDMSDAELGHIRGIGDVSMREIFSKIDHLKSKTDQDLVAELLGGDTRGLSEFALLRDVPDIDHTRLFDQLKPIMHLPIYKLGLPNHIMRVLTHHDICTIRDLLQLEELDLWRMSHYSTYSIKVIQNKLLDLIVINNTVSHDDQHHADRIVSERNPQSILLNQSVEEISKQEESSPTIDLNHSEDINYLSIDHIGLSIRTLNALKRQKIFRLGQLIRLTDDQILTIKNIGEESLDDIKTRLSQFAGKYEESPVISLDQITPNARSDQTPYYLLRYQPQLKLNMLIQDSRTNAVFFRNGTHTIVDLVVHWETFCKFKGIVSSTEKIILDALREPETFPADSLTFDYLHALIEKIGNTPIEKTGLSSDARDHLSKVGLLTIKDVISNFNCLELQHLINLNLRKEIISHIFHWLRNPTDLNMPVDLHIPEEKFEEQKIDFGPEEGVKQFFEILPDRNLAMISDLYGFNNGTSQTLEVTSQTFGVTRERIRQIMVNAKIRVASYRNAFYISPFLNEVSTHITEQGGLVSAQNLDLIRARLLPELGYYLHPLLQFILETKLMKEPDFPIQYIKSLNAYTAGQPSDQIEAIYQALANILQASQLPLQWDDLYQKLSALPAFVTLDEKLAFSICQSAKEINHISQFPNGTWRYGKGRLKREEMLTAALAQIGEPAHFEKLAETCNCLFPFNKLTSRGALAVLQSNVESFTRFGRGIYGLLEWSIYNDGNVGNAVRRILSSNNRPMSIDEIETEVLKTWDVQPSAIIAAINNDARFITDEFGFIKLTDYGMTTKKRTKRDDEFRSDRVFQTLKSIGSECKINLIVESHNSNNPEKPLTRTSIKSLILRNPELFMRTGKDTFALTEWKLMPYQQVDINREKEVLELIEVRGPITLGTLNDLYNQKYPDRQLNEDDLKSILRKLKEKVIDSRTGEYFAFDRNEIDFQSKQRYGNKPDHIQKIINVLKVIGTPSHVDYIFNGYLNKYPFENMQYSVIRNALYAFENEFKSYGEGVFGLPEWK